MDMLQLTEDVTNLARMYSKEEPYHHIAIAIGYADGRNRCAVCARLIVSGDPVIYSKLLSYDNPEATFRHIACVPKGEWILIILTEYWEDTRKEDIKLESARRRGLC